MYYMYTGVLKRAATFKAAESEKQALNKPCNLMQTRSKSTTKQKGYSNQKIKFLFSIKPIEAAILDI